MKILFRMEDKYGIYSMSRLFKSIEVEEDNDNSGINRVKGTDTYIQRGLGIANVFRISNKDLISLKKLGIKRIICVHDLDSVSGEGNDEILSKEEVLELLSTTDRHMKELGMRVEIVYLPTVFNAESILLYGLYNFPEDILMYRSPAGTKELHLALVAGTLRCSKKKCKHYIETHEDIKNQIKRGFQIEISKKRTNDILLRWIIDSNIENYQYYDLEGLFCLLEKIKSESKYIKAIIIGDKKYNVETLNDISKMYRELLK